MKRFLPITLYFFVPFFLSAQATFTEYGAVGDGVADDTYEIQQAIQNEPYIIAEPNKVFRLTQRIYIDHNMEHFIDWNNAIVTTDSAISQLFRIDKRDNNGHHTTMKDLIIEGDNVLHSAIETFTPTTLLNVDIRNLSQGPLGDNTSSTAGIAIKISDSTSAFGDYLLDDCDIANVTATDDNDIGGSQGAAYPLFIQWQTVPTDSTTVTVQNGTFDGSWGEDGCLIYIEQSNNDIAGTGNHNYFNNLTFKNWQRRAVKGFCSEQTWENCTFYDTPENHPKRTYNSSSAGLLSIDGSNLLFKDCRFIGVDSINPNLGIDKRLIFSNAQNAKVENCSFERGIVPSFVGHTGDILFCGNEFGHGSVADDYQAGNNPNVDLGGIIFDADNVFTEPDFFAELEYFTCIDTSWTCTEMDLGYECTDTVISVIASSCESYTVPSGDETYTISGQYMDTIPNTCGLDSLLLIDVTINSFEDMGTSTDGLTISANNDTAAAYQWIDCSDNSILAGETSASYTAIENGEYAVIINNANCSDTSECVVINDVSIDEVLASGLVKVFPNPANDFIHVNLPKSLLSEELSYSVYNSAGQDLLSGSLLESSPIDVQELSSGVYFIQFKSEGKIFQTRFVKE